MALPMISKAGYKVYLSKEFEDEDMKQFLVDNYLKMTTVELAKRLNSTGPKVNNALMYFGLSKCIRGDSLPGEEFTNLKKIGFSKYEISNMIRFRNDHNEIIRQYIISDNYMSVKMVDDNGVRQCKRVCRIVAQMFIPNDDPAHKIQVNHIDGNKSNDNIDNLEWVTPSQNAQHAIDTGLKSPYDLKTNKHVIKTHTEEDVHRVCKLLSEGYSIMRIAREYPMYTYSWIRDIYRGNLKWAMSIVDQYGVKRK